MKTVSKSVSDFRVIVYLTVLNYYGFMPTVFTAFLYLNAFLTSFRLCSSNKKFIYSLKILCFRRLLISFTHQNSGTDCMINMARVRFVH